MRQLGRERFEASEILFEPTMVEFSTQGLGQLVFDSIREADTTIRGILYKNILLSGGTTMLPGFPDRLKKDIEDSWRMFVNRNPNDERTAAINVVVGFPMNRHLPEGTLMSSLGRRSMQRPWRRKETFSGP